MPGNSARRGAVRKPGSKKGPAVGSGGRGRQALEGRGPTPKAEDRTWHARKGKGGKGDQAIKRPGKPPRRPSERVAEVVAGRNPVVEALRAGVHAKGLQVFSHIDADDRVTEALRLAVNTGVEVKEVSRADLDVLTQGATHQGIALLVAPFAYVDPKDLLDAAGTPLIVALDGIQDPRNLGAILRSAAAFGATGALIPERRAAAVTVAAWKTSAGAAARIPIGRAVNLPRAIHDLKAAGCFVVGLAGDGDIPLAESRLLGEPLVIVVGSEGKGLSRLVREECDQVASIPIAASMESLNASVAASLALYEASRARGSKP